MKNPAWLLEFASKVHSQTGEDGIIQKVLETIPEKDFWCVEFGAWDGIRGSNSRNLIERHQYQAVLIEGNAPKFHELQKNYSNNAGVIPVHAFVGFYPDNGLDSILKTTPIPENFDFLCIDIDGNDYHAWQAMEIYTPKVVCIEYNPTIPTEVEFIQTPNPSLNQGSSLLSLVKLAQSKGYELICAMLFNATFVRKEYFPLFEIEDNQPETLRKDLSRITYVFSTYDGEVHLRGFKGLPWHKVKLIEPMIQPLPRILRKLPSNYSAFERFLFKIYKAWTGWCGLNFEHSWQNTLDTVEKNGNIAKGKNNK